MAGLLGADIDASHLAAEWRDRVSRIARNLTDFNDSEACARVKARYEDPARRYRGKTEIAARQAIGALDALWQDYLLVSRVVDEADGLAKRSGLLVNNNDEVVEMLTGASIKLPAVSIPVRNRGLLDTPEQQGKVTPADVLNSMIKAFDVARVTVAEIDDAETKVGARLAALRATIEELKTWSAAQGLEAFEVAAPPLDDVEGDPLGALDRLLEAEAEIAKLGTRRAALAAQIAALDQGLARARDGLGELKATLDEAKKARDGSVAQFEDAALALDPRLEMEIAELDAWLDTLATAKSRARPAAVLIGLGKWEEARAAKLALVKAPIEALRRLAAERDDIAGRLRALRAKGASLSAARRALPGALAMAEDAAKIEVRRVPFRVDVAQALVKAYEDALTQFARTS